MAFISRQPNGLLCRFSTVLDCITDYNMTEEQYIEMCAEKARKEARDVIAHHLEPFSMIEDMIQVGEDAEMTEEEWEKIKKEMEETK